jgi:hypothetical protein
MSRRHALVVFATLSSFGASCRSAPEPDPIPASIPGSYVYAASGATLKKPWQFAAKLDLDKDGTFQLTLDKTVDGAKDPTEQTRGTYVVSGDKVWITGVEGGRKNRDRHALVIKADSLIGEIDWSTHMVLRGLGAPDPVFVKQEAT